jgi:hypothetical protein
MCCTSLLEKLRENSEASPGTPFMRDGQQGSWPLLNDGEGTVLYCVISLYLFSEGGGRRVLIAARETCTSGLVVFYHFWKRQ